MMMMDDTLHLRYYFYAIGSVPSIGQSMCSKKHNAAVDRKVLVKYVVHFIMV